MSGNFENQNSFRSFAPSKEVMEDRIVIKAGELMLQNGIRQMTMDDLANQLGMSKKTIYQYFTDKESLVMAVVDKQVAYHSENCMICQKKADNAVHELFMMLEQMQVMVKTMNPFIMMELEKNFPAAFHKIKKMQEEFLIEIIKANLEKGIKEGLYRKEIDKEIVSRYRLETVFIPFNLKVFPQEKFNPVTVHTQLNEHFVYGLMTPKGYELMEQYKKAHPQLANPHLNN